jgi:dihydropteroate synthase
MGVLAKRGCKYIAMHMHGEPGTMQRSPLNKENALQAMDKFVESAVGAFERANFPASARYVDPGIGFGKSDAANLALLTRLPLYARQCQVAVGISRKSMFGRLLGIEIPEKRDNACKVVEFLLGVLGADIVRTHDVATLVAIRKTYDLDL